MMWKKDYNRGKSDTSWQKVGKWYGDLVGDRGHYYHSHVIIPNCLRLLGLEKSSSLLDLACGEGVLARSIPTGVDYEGLDLAPDLIARAKLKDRNNTHRYLVADVTHKLPTQKKNFSHGAMILALQNIRNPEAVFFNVGLHLKSGGKFVMVINHPYYRIPRQSGWGVDENNKSQYRKVYSYMSRQEIPVLANPGLGSRSAQSWSFHYPLAEISQMANKNGLVIETIEEWTSDKKSEGRVAKMENRSRQEIPLFMALTWRKIG